MPCRAELPHLADLEKTFEGEPVTVIALLSGRLTGATAEFAKDCEVIHLVCEDVTGEIRDAFGTVSVPTTVVIDETGRVMFEHVGFDEGLEEQFAEEIRTLLAWARET
ncbi:MAG: TlpA disulfide reductase family protein [Candidatus Eisenbacteria bacterium]